MKFSPLNAIWFGLEMTGRLFERAVCHSLLAQVVSCLSIILQVARMASGFCNNLSTACPCVLATDHFGSALIRQ
jgi:hypothetical protein